MTILFYNVTSESSWITSVCILEVSRCLLNRLFKYFMILFVLSPWVCKSRCSISTNLSNYVFNHPCFNDPMSCYRAIV
jgi:hypothetical protein